MPDRSAAVVQFRSEPPVVRALAIVQALVLLVGVVTALGHDQVGAPTVAAPATTETDASDATERSAPAGSDDDRHGPADDPTAPSDAPDDGASDDGSAPGPVRQPGAGTTTTGPGPSDPGGSTDERATPGTRQTPSELRLRASDRGVTADAIKVAFPYFAVEEAFSIVGASSARSENHEDAIRAYVEDINARGGIAGRRIEALIEEYNPVNEADMRARCLRWTQDDEVFAVVDTNGWHGQHQLCLTEENDTPLISGWTSAAEWTERGAPYLWWTGASAEETVENWILWADEAGWLDGHTIGLLISDRSGDAITRAFAEEVFAHVGVQPIVAVIPFDTASGQAAVPSAVQRMKAGEVDVVFNALPFIQTAQWLNQAESQSYFPQYLISDYETQMPIHEAVYGSQFPRSLDGAVGPTLENFGNPGEEPDVYTPEEARCDTIWRAAYDDAEHLSRLGIGMRWCQAITLFVTAAERATRAGGGDLTRLGWAQQMGAIRDLPATVTPRLSYSAQDRSGPVQTKVVIVATSGCTSAEDGNGNGVCLRTVSPYAPYRRR